MTASRIQIHTASWFALLENPRLAVVPFSLEPSLLAPQETPHSLNLESALKKKKRINR